MAWLVMPRQIANPDGTPSGKWRLTALSNEDGGGPHGNPLCQHDTPEESETCKDCLEFVGKVTGFPPDLTSLPSTRDVPGPLGILLRHQEAIANQHLDFMQKFMNGLNPELTSSQFSVDYGPGVGTWDVTMTRTSWGELEKRS